MTNQRFCYEIIKGMVNFLISAYTTGRRVYRKKNQKIWERKTPKKSHLFSWLFHIEREKFVFKNLEER